jgi:hypothetical protein
VAEVCVTAVASPLATAGGLGKVLKEASPLSAAGPFGFLATMRKWYVVF